MFDSCQLAFGLLHVHCSAALIIASENEAHALDISSRSSYKMELVTEEWKIRTVVLCLETQAFFS